MKICFVMPYFYSDKPAGAEIQAYMIGRELARRGYEVHYLCENFKKDEFKRKKVEGLTVQKILNHLKVFRVLNFFQMFIRCQRLKPEVYYQRMVSPYTGMVGIAAKLLGGRFIWACSEDATLQKNYFITLQMQHFKSYNGSFIKKAILLLDSVINQYLFNAGIRLATICVVQNVYQKEKLFETYRREGIIIKSGHRPVNGKIKKTNPPVILWVNSISKRKQPELFIDLAEQCQDLHCKFIMVGGQPKKAYLDSVLLRARGLTDFEYLGQIPFEETNEWFRRAALSINTTSGGEGFPNTFIQSWFNEAPVISLGTDPDDILTENKIGFHSKSFEQMIADTKFLVRNPKIRNEMGTRARIFAEREYDISKIVNDYEAIMIGNVKHV